MKRLFDSMTNHPVSVLLLAAILLATPAAAQSSLDAKISTAIERGRNALLLTQTREGEFAASLGDHALVMLALLHTGLRADHPAIVKGLAPLCRDTRLNYEHAVRLMVIEWVRTATLSRGRFFFDRTLTRVADEDLEALIQNQNRDGTWSYSGGNPGRGYDHSNSQYALLGLRAADKMGMQIPREVWQRTLRHFSYEVGSDGGVGYTSKSKPTASMTAGALSSLIVCRARCGWSARHPKMKRAQTAIKRATRFLARRWKPKGKVWPYYTLYGLERAMLYARLDKLGKRDWYETGAKWLIEKQDRAGVWPRSRRRDTCFALLFLSRAVRPTAGETDDVVGFTLSSITPQSSAKQLDQSVAILRKKGRPIAKLLVPFLSSPIRNVRTVTMRALRGLSSRRFGFDPGQTPERNAAAIDAWKRLFE